MRRTIPLSVAAVLAVLALAVGVGFGQPISSHGGAPSDVYMKTQPPPDDCVSDINPDSVIGFPLQIEVTATSHVLGSFSFEWHGLERGEIGGLNLVLDGTGSGSQYVFATSGPRINTSGTVTWSFPNVAPGTHTLAVFAVVNPIINGLGTTANPDLVAGLTHCSLTAFVAPVAPA